MPVVHSDFGGFRMISKSFQDDREAALAVKEGYILPIKPHNNRHNMPHLWLFSAYFSLTKKSQGNHLGKESRFLPLKIDMCSISLRFVSLIWAVDDSALALTLPNEGTMQNEINLLFSNLTPQTLGMTDSASILGLSLLAPGLIIFALFVLAHSLKPRWRGYWDAV